MKKEVYEVEVFLRGYVKVCATNLQEARIKVQGGKGAWGKMEDCEILQVDEAKLVDSNIDK
jgi:hypothetical protein